MRTPDLQLRPITDDDEGFLSALYASTREAEMNELDWDAAQKADFLALQFRMQHQYYQQHYKQACFDIVMLGEKPVGRLYHQWGGHEVRIMDIALLPEHRNQGLGSALIGALLQLADRRGLEVSLHAEYYNPVLAMYGRLGFQEVGENGVYRKLVRNPIAASDAAPLSSLCAQLMHEPVRT
ncbi:MAG: GNAT family N-acetyltransferase [Burkholderiaceae bacterium]|nr:GNAT family N-acetyltransferase [Burkholderiaceae bacterium]